jgi:KDO2-lipid IV(A) lauroyltransferase
MRQQPSTATDKEPAVVWLRVISGLPWDLLYAFTAGLAFLARYVVRHRVRVARENLRLCFPDRSEREREVLLNAHYRHLGQVLAESLKLASMTEQQMRAHVQLLHFDRVHAETAAGRSVLLLAAHQCNWEWVLQGTVLGIEVPCDAAYKPLHSTAADRELRKLRCRFGARLIAAKRLVREVLKRRRELHAIALMADQMPASSGGRHWLPFLGRDTAFYPGPAEIARLTGYAAFFAAMRRTARGRYVIEMQPISAAGEQLEPEIFTARYVRLVEDQVRSAPADWMWIHRRWKFQRTAAAPEA